MVMTRRLFPATNAVEDQNHPDDLLNNIPFHAKAVSDFNMNSPHCEPYSDVPSVLIAAITNPATGPEPDWGAMLAYYRSNHAISGLANLQDLYFWVTRVGIPNAVVDNRRFLLHFYARNGDALINLRLRYDASLGISQSSSFDHYVPLSTEMQADSLHTIPNHSIFQSYETPDGLHFAQWLSAPVHTPDPNLLPSQMYHQRSVLDGFINEDEAEVRQVSGGALMERPVRVCRLFWWLWWANRMLLEYQQRGWVGMDREMVGDDNEQYYIET
jgi:hypothetical protein